MCTHIHRAVQRWAREQGLAAPFLAALEQDAPWVFCGDGLSEELASELLADVFPQFKLGESEARLFARLLNALSEFEAPSEVPERLAASERIVELLNGWQPDDRVSERAMWLGYESTASFRPTVHIASGALPPQQLIAELESAARQCPYYDALVFMGPSNQELAVVELRPNDG